MTSIASKYNQDVPGLSSDYRWLDSRKEFLTWEETLKDPLLQRFLRNKSKLKQPDLEIKSNKLDQNTSFVKSQQTVLAGVPFSDFGISIKEKMVLYKKRQKEIRRANVKIKDAEVQTRMEDDMVKAFDFEAKYMKRQKLPLYQSRSLIFNLNDLDRLIRAFLLNDKQSQLSLCAMDASIRSIVKDLLAIYNMNYSVMGKKDQKHLALYKTKSSGIPQWDKKQVQFDQVHPSGVVFNSPPLLNVIHALHIKWVKSCHQNCEYQKFSEVCFIESCNEGIEPTNNKDVTIVGKDAPELTESNIGFRMLLKMGWKPEEPGTTKALKASPLPFRVVIHRGKSGLGYDSES